MGFAIVVTLLVVFATNGVIGVFYNINGSSKDYITSGYFDIHLPDGLPWEIYTDGMDVAITIVRILFITFPIATAIAVSGTYIQGLGEDKRTSILLFGKVATLFILAFILGFAAPNLIHGEWSFLTEDGLHIDNLNNYKNASVGLFLSLPITDVLIGLLLIYYLIDAEKKIIIPMGKEKIV